MPKIGTYHRPVTVDEAVRLLAEPGTVALGGGTQLIAAGEAHAGVVDLQAVVGLDEIVIDDWTVTLGAMVRLQTMIDQEAVPLLLRQSAHREGPNTFRHAGTVGGVVAVADPESELFAALLVHEAEVLVQGRGGQHRLPLADFAPRHGDLIVSVQVRRGGITAADRVARTPADRPIVAAVARRDERNVLRLALCGVANRPVLADARPLNPPPDFRGTSDYRRSMAALLSQRVLAALDKE